jgi:putative flippase GtrA
VINSFFWNRAWTFRSSADPRRTFVPFFLSNLVGLIINAGVMYVGLHVFGLHDALAFLLATVVTLGWNFVVSKFIVFRR